jgi:hypothetical protein
MVGARGAGIVAAYRRDRRPVGEKNSLCLYLGFRLELRVLTDDFFHSGIHAREGLLQSLARIKISLGASAQNPSTGSIQH